VNKGNPTVSVDPPPSLAMIQLITSFWVLRAIYIAAKLGIADLLKDESKTIGELAEATGSHLPSLYRLLRALASVGIFAEEKQGRFAMTPLGATLQTDVSGSLRAWVNVQLGEEHYRAWGDPMQTVQTGESAFHNVFGMGVWEYRARNPEHAKLFDKAMANLTGMYNTAVLSSYPFSRFEKIVDVGGGHGGLLIAILDANPGVKGVLFDIPPVAEKARQRMTNAGLAERCQVVGGDVFSSVPDGGDAYILSRVIHDWDDAHSIAILKNCHRAMVSTGRLLLIEGVIRPGNEPDITKLFDLNMMMLSGGRERTAAEYQTLVEAAGFAMGKIIPTQSVVGVSVIECMRARNQHVTR
jgi:ubiquinone/menaquinone biosynthesis C-methylase UbiE